MLSSRRRFGRTRDRRGADGRTDGVRPGSKPTDRRETSSSTRTLRKRGWRKEKTRRKRRKLVLPPTPPPPARFIIVSRRGNTARRTRRGEGRKQIKNVPRRRVAFGGGGDNTPAGRVDRTKINQRLPATERRPTGKPTVPNREREYIGPAKRLGIGFD